MEYNNLITAIVPTHNEEKIILDTLDSLVNQTTRIDNILVVCDNCTDNTINLVSSYIENNKSETKVEIYETKNNSSKKAGALNQILNHGSLGDYILVMDADTIIDKDAVYYGLRKLESDERLGAVCSKAGLIKPESMNLYESILWGLQHIEYAGFDSHRVETEGNIKVAHGMCTLFRKQALLGVSETREQILGVKDNIYLEDNLTEDYEVTLCLKHKWKLASSLDMKAYTEVPLSIKELYIQRLRWLRGGVDTLRMHGFNKVTLPEILNHYLFVFLSVLRLLAVIMAVEFILVNGEFQYAFLVFSVIAFNYFDSVYRLRYVENISVLEYLIKFSILIEVFYAWFQSYILIMSYVYSYLDIEQNWG